MNLITLKPMRKSFLGVSLAALVASLPVSAEEWQIGLSGEFNQYLGYVSYDGATSSDFDGFDAVGTAQVSIVPMVTLNSGLRFGSYIELEGHYGERNAGVAFDEASLFVRGGFGEVLVGKSDTPGNHMQFGAPSGYGPDVNFAGLSSVSLPSLLQFSNVHNNVRVGDDLLRGTLGSTQVSNTGEETQGRITYFSPRLAGFQLGVSYAPEEPNQAPNRQDFFDIGANYTNNFNGLDVGVSAKWGTADNFATPAANPEYWGVGVSLGYGRVSVGGSYAESSGSAAGITDGRAFDLGATYRAGRFGYSLNYFNGENTDNENAGLGTRERLETVTLAVGYDLKRRSETLAGLSRPGSDHGGDFGLPKGMGAMVFGFVSYADFSEDVGDGGIATPGDNINGFVVGTGLRLNF